MNVLFLDDCPNRSAKFRSECPSATMTTTALEAIAALQKEEFDIAFLDHDLGGETYCEGSRTDCGMEVCRWIVQNRPRLRRIIVHTLNLPAAENMVWTLQNSHYHVTYIPFTLLFQPG